MNQCSVYKLGKITVWMREIWQHDDNWKKLHYISIVLFCMRQKQEKID